MPPYLPGEITDHIIRFVWPDKHGLCSCSLVCQKWLPASRHYLFFRLTTSPSSYDKLVEQLNQSSSMRMCLPSVYTFTFLVPLAELTLEDLIKGQRFIHDFSSHLPNLRRAEFLSTFFGTKMHPRLHLALNNFRQLRELSLVFCRFDSLNTLRRMIVALPGLTSLALRFLSWSLTSFAAFPVRSADQALPALECLSLTITRPGNTPDPASLFDALIGLPTPSRISLFVIDAWEEEEVEPLYLGPLGFMNRLSSPEPSAVRDLTISSSLMVEEHLGLSLAGARTASPARAFNWVLLCRLLQDVRSPLRYIRLSVKRLQRRRYITEAFLHGMEALDSVLEGKAFRHLKAVTFVVITEYLSPPNYAPSDKRSLCSDELFHEPVRVKLPKLYARGIVTFPF